ncbi:MAG: hypothetical protein RJA22_1483 [Verrucomicrobiota bacterium]|jgi:thiol-disulfide isomerase/thioredoxin
MKLLPLTTLALLLASLIGCGRSDAPAPAPSTNPTAGTPQARKEVPTANLDLSAALPAAPLSEGDKAWREVLAAMEPPPFPAAWETQPPSEAEQKAFARTNALLTATAAERARDFYTRFPDHAQAALARERERELLGVSAQLGNTNALTRLAALTEARLKDPSLPEEERLALRLEQLQQSLEADPGTNPVARVDALEKSVRALRKEFTNNTEVVGLLLAVAQGRLSLGQTDQARALAVEVADAIADPDIQEAAQALLKNIQRVGQPLALKFKAIDGRDVDLAALRGKVVLIDFWATWCGPCMAEMPKVKALHEKENPRGFEIIGISLDRDRKALERILARDKIPWPQHMEAAPGAEKFSDNFGIESIPTLWLIDKKGNLRDLNAIEDLEGKVAKLLAE